MSKGFFCRNKSCAVEPEVQTDDFQQLAFGGHIRDKPFLFQSLRKFKHVLGLGRSFRAISVVCLHVQA
jgi:hypothetical protein